MEIILSPCAPPGGCHTDRRGNISSGYNNLSGNYFQLFYFRKDCTVLNNRSDIRRLPFRQNMPDKYQLSSPIRCKAGIKALFPSNSAPFLPVRPSPQKPVQDNRQKRRTFHGKLNSQEENKNAAKKVYQPKPGIRKV